MTQSDNGFPTPLQRCLAPQALIYSPTQIVHVQKRSCRKIQLGLRCSTTTKVSSDPAQIMLIRREELTDQIIHRNGELEHCSISRLSGHCDRIPCGNLPAIPLPFLHIRVPSRAGQRFSQWSTIPGSLVSVLRSRSHSIQQNIHVSSHLVARTKASLFARK